MNFRDRPFVAAVLAAAIVWAVLAAVVATLPGDSDWRMAFWVGFAATLGLLASAAYKRRRT